MLRKLLVIWCTLICYRKWACLTVASIKAFNLSRYECKEKKLAIYADKLIWYAHIHLCRWKKTSLGPVPFFILNASLVKYCVDMFCSTNYIPWWRNIPCNVIVQDVLCSCACVCVRCLCTDRFVNNCLLCKDSVQYYKTDLHTRNH